MIGDYRWNDSEGKDFEGGAVTKMKNVTNYRPRDQKEADVWEFVLENASLLSEQGTVVQSWRGQDKKYGPFYRLDYKADDGRRRAVYLGADQELAAQVRQRLAELQAPQKERRLLARARRVARWELRKTIRALEQQIAGLGLTRRGSRILGYRSAGGFERIADRQRGGRHDD